VVESVWFGDATAGNYDMAVGAIVSTLVDPSDYFNAWYRTDGPQNYSFWHNEAFDKLWFSDDVMKYPHDPARARQLLAEIGLKDTNGDGFLEDAEGHTIEVSLVTNSSNSQRVETAAFCARSMQEVGIKASAVPSEMGFPSCLPPIKAIPNRSPCGISAMQIANEVKPTPTSPVYK